MTSLSIRSWLIKQIPMVGSFRARVELRIRRLYHFWDIFKLIRPRVHHKPKPKQRVLSIHLKNPRYSLFYSSSPTYDQQIDTEVLCGRMLEINPASVCSFVFISKVFNPQQWLGVRFFFKSSAGPQAPIIPMTTYFRTLASYVKTEIESETL